jgi:hypothetical protein
MIILCLFPVLIVTTLYILKKSVEFINLDDHSNNCIRVKDEVIVADTANHSCHTLDLKLRKLEEHLSNIEKHDISVKNSSSFSDLCKDMHYLSLLKQYIIDAILITSINHSSITSLKKIITNIDVIFINIDINFYF